jgi:hypothetical protein
MNTGGLTRMFPLAIGLLVFCCLPSVPEQKARGKGTNPIQISAERDGQHDFDFVIGRWKSHTSRLVHPLSGSNAWEQYDGISTNRKVWNGRANLAELEADGPAGHLEVLCLRLYNPKTRQWNLNYAHSSDGTLETPLIGSFRGGRGVFYDKEAYHGRPILVRQIWSDITPHAARFEQAFSADGGKTWEGNWIEVFTKVD